MKSTVIILLTLLIQATSHSQAIRNIGVKLGGVAANQSWTYSSIPSLPTERRWGIDVGVFIEWFNMPVFSLSSELHFIQKGMKLTLPITSEQNPEGTGRFVTRSPRVDYLSLPLLAKARLNDGVFSPYVVAGPRVDFLLQTKAEEFQAVLDKFETVEFGATVGAGMDIRAFEKMNLGFEFRFSPSLKDGYSTQFLSVRNTSMEFLIVAGF